MEECSNFLNKMKEMFNDPVERSTPTATTTP